MSLELWLAFVAASLVILAIPGPTVLLVVSYALGHGRRPAAAIVAGVALGDLTSMTASMLGLGAVLAASAAAFTALRWLGGAYLIYLGVKLWRAPLAVARDPEAEPTSLARMFAHAFAVTALNPKSIVFFVAFAPQFLSSRAPFGPQVVVMEATFVALAARFPWLNTDGIAGATLGLSGEGWFDAHLLLSAVRRAAKDASVVFRQAEVAEVERGPSRIEAIRTADGGRITCGTVICAAGPRSGALARLWGAALPVEPRKRSVFVVRGKLDGSGMGMLFDPSGLWIRPEGDGFICGMKPLPERDPHPGEDFEPDHYIFEERLWPALAHRIPAMEELRLVRSWAGHYEMNLLDHNGIVGPDPAWPNLIYATGFSGHGVMHAPATGRAVAEWVLHGGFRTLDLSPLGFGRIARGETFDGAPVHQALLLAR